jgi:hypothetical protein
MRGVTGLHHYFTFKDRINEATYQDVEYDSHTDEDLPTREIELIDIGGEPSNYQIICECQWNCCSDGVIGPDVGEDCHLGGDLDVAPHEAHE